MKKTSIFFILTAICVSSFNGMIGDNTTLAANLPQGPKKLNTTTVNIINKVPKKDDDKKTLGKSEAKPVQKKAPKKDDKKIDSKLKEAAIEEDKKVVGNKPLSKPKPSQEKAPKKVAAAPSPPKVPVALTPEQQQKQMSDIQRQLHEQDEVNKVILNAVQHDRKILKSHHEAISAIGKQGSVEPP
ncbi:hypothetical protein HOK96_02050, partial [bacterium]|nr:hypothetical protein [bacterium]